MTIISCYDTLIVNKKPRKVYNMKTKDLTLIALFSVLIAICSWISIPSAVPFTLQTFAVFLAVGLLGGKRGTLSILTYILLGTLGVPVFANFTGGVGVLLGSTGGYILGFLGSAIILWTITRIFGEKTGVLAIGMVAGALVYYTFGTVWFMMVYIRTHGAVSLLTVLTWCVFPFIIPDLIKILLALFLTKKLKGRILV